MEWAAVGSGERLAGNPDAHWVGTVQVLVDAGACTDAITLSADDPKPPSAAVADLLRGHRLRKLP